MAFPVDTRDNQAMSPESFPPRRNSIADGLTLPAPSTNDAAEQAKKKRRHRLHGSVDEDGRLVGEVEAGSHSSKRRRYSNWPLTEEQPASPGRSPTASRNRRHIASPIRPSRFREASMHDRASDKPPSMFTRAFNASSADMGIDQLMDDYHAANEKRPGTWPSVNPSQVHSRSLTHHPNQSFSNRMDADGDENKTPGIFRFGRSLAAAFNPMNIWQKMAQKWQEARQELIEEELDEQAAQLKLRMERAARAQEVYAQLKQAGQLGTQGAYGMNGMQVFTPGYTVPAGGSQRDSGIAGIEGADNRPFHLQEHDTPVETRKYALHFRTPSFANLKLKKARSEANLSRKRSSPSPEKDTQETPHSLRKSQSKKDMQKQLKLSKRVSDLEIKLKDARRELYQALGESPAPPVPALPAYLAESMSTDKRPRIPSPFKRPFKPNEQLPTLPSEGLLLHGDIDNREEPPVDAPSSDPPQPEDTPMPIRHAALPDTPGTDIWLADIQSAKYKKQTSSKRKSGDDDDLTYNPTPEPDDDAEREKAIRPKKQKGATKGKGKGKSGARTKKHPDVSERTETQATAESAEVEVQEIATTAVSERQTDETVVTTETEAQRVTLVALKDAPRRPTAFSTPAHPNKNMRTNTHARSSSPAPQGHDGTTTTTGFPAEMSEDEIICVEPNKAGVPPMPPLPEDVEVSGAGGGVVNETRKEGKERREKRALKTAATAGRDRGREKERDDDSFEWPDDVF